MISLENVNVVYDDKPWNVTNVWKKELGSILVAVDKVAQTNKIYLSDPLR